MTKKTTDPFRYDLIPSGSTVLCALSGGADSMYLLCRLQEAGISVHAAHFNHRLRAAADRDEQFVRDWCHTRGIPLTVGNGDVAAYAGECGTGTEEAGRILRYQFLQTTAAATGCSLIATGHHALDNAETVLMNLIRGCGTGGLSGIPERRGNIIRPMLSVKKDEIERYLIRHSIPHVEDESNEDLTYIRNRVRHQLIPLMEELNPRAVEHITATAHRAAEDDGELRRQAELLLAESVETDAGISISCALLTQSPRPVALRLLKTLAPETQAIHLEELLNLCKSSDPSARLDLPGKTALRVYDRLLFAARPSAPPEPAPLREGEQIWGGWHIRCIPAICPQKAYLSPEEFYLKTDSYLIRSRKEGDELKLGRRPRKTIKNLMIETRIPRHLRAGTPVLADSTDLAAAAGGLGPHWEALALPGTPCLKITIQKGE